MAEKIYKPSHKEDWKGWYSFIIEKLYQNANGRYDENGNLIEYSMEEIHRYSYLQTVKHLSKKVEQMESMYKKVTKPDSDSNGTIILNMLRAEKERFVNLFDQSLQDSRRKATDEKNFEELRLIDEQTLRIKENRLPRIAAVNGRVGNALLLHINLKKSIPETRKDLDFFLNSLDKQPTKGQLSDALNYFEINSLISKHKRGPSSGL